jgi:prevent-host-death family protein
MERRLGISEARRQLADLVEQVRYKKDSYIIVRRGRPTAALVPVDVYESWKREREQLFATIRKIQGTNPDADPDEVMRDVLEAQREARAAAD